MSRGFASASLAENVRFNQAVVIPNALQGIFRRRARAVGVATRTNVDGQAAGLIADLRRKYGSGPLWVRLIRDPALLLLDTDDVRRALEGSPEPFASDPPGKRDGMAAFQPDALTISRGDLWARRRAFAEEVLDSAQERHRLADRFTAVAGEEMDALTARLRADGEPLDLRALAGAYQRMTRRIVLGDAAADDEVLTEELAELMEQANGMPGERHEPFDDFQARMTAYLAAGQEGSLAGIASGVATDPDTRADGQLTHWLFATADTLGANVARALALLCVHPDAAPRDALLEAMRLWPTTPMLAREVTRTLTWDGVRVEAGTQVLIVNVFHHRDPERLGERAHRFSPEGWHDGSFAGDWGLNHLSHGPQGCPGANLAVLLGVATLEALLAAGPRLERPDLDADGPLPHMLNPYGLRFSLDAG